MPGSPDLELQDMFCKQYMEPNLPFDNLSPDVEEMWSTYNYNFFTDENQTSGSNGENSSIKDEIKEEISDMDYCFSSICPNDLLSNELNNLDEYTTERSIKQQFDHQLSTNSIEYNLSASSSMSSSPNLDEMKSSSIQIQTFNFAQSILDGNNNPGVIVSIGNNSDLMTNNKPHTDFGLFDVDNDVLSSSSSAYYSPSNSSMSSPASSTQINHNNTIEYIVPNRQGGVIQLKLDDNDIHQKNKNVPVMNISTSVPGLDKSQLLVLDTCNIEADLMNQSGTNELTSQKSKDRQSLPPSPPSSLGSDNESNHSTTVSNPVQNISLATCPVINNSKSSKTSSKNVISNGLVKSSNNKLNNTTSQSKSTTILKQIRHQPYSTTIKLNNSNMTVSSKTKSCSATSSKSNANVVTNNNLNTSSSSNNNSDSKNSNCASDDDCWPFFCSLSKLPSSGPLLLTEEEKRTLVQEGHQVPTQLPLSKGEEKILKKIRRKIKNKISAQESRRKKKEYVDSLEKRMENYINENTELKKRLEDIELDKKSLLSQLQKIQATLNRQEQQLSQPQQQFYISDPVDSTNTNDNQFGKLLMVLVLFFAVLLGVWSPVMSKDQISPSTAATTAASSISRCCGSSNSIGSSSSNTAAAVAVATAAAAAASVMAVKPEAQDSNQSEQEEQKPQQKLVNIVDSGNLRSFSPSFVTSSSKTNVLLPTNDDELMNFECSSDSSSSLVTTSFSSKSDNNNSLISSSNTARSKTGIAVELTKVRPFIRKLQTIQKTSYILNKSGSLTFPIINQQGANGTLPANNEYNEQEPQIIILNLASNNIPSSPQSNSGDSAAVPIFTGASVCKPNQNYRLINQTPSTTIGSAKLAPTRFRLVNNSSLNTINNNNIINTVTSTTLNTATLSCSQ